MKIIPKFQPGGAINYKVEYGDTISNIAKAYGVTIKEIKDANNLNDKYFIRAGLNLIIPVENSKNEEIKKTYIKDKLAFNPYSEETEKSAYDYILERQHNYLNDVKLVPKRHNWTKSTNNQNKSTTTKLVPKASVIDLRGLNNPEDNWYFNYRDPVAKKDVLVYNKSVLYGPNGTEYVIDINPDLIRNLYNVNTVRVRVYKNGKSQGYRELTPNQLRVLTTVSPYEKEYNPGDNFKYMPNGNGYYYDENRNRYFNPYNLMWYNNRDGITDDINKMQLHNVKNAFNNFYSDIEK